MSKIELKPCLCGGKAEKIKIFVAKRYDCLYKCDRCGYETKVFVSPQGAKNAWNRRADNENTNEHKPNLIKNWTFKIWSSWVVICGTIYNDTSRRFPDGTYIHTSKVEFIDFRNGVVKTKNSLYVLDMEGADNEQRETDL